MASFLDLAPELVARINNSLGLDDLKNTRLTCKQLGRYLEDCVFHCLTLHVSYENREESISMIRSLAKGEYPAISRSVRHLSIGSLSASTIYDPRIRTFWIFGGNNKTESNIMDKIENGQRVRYLVYPAELERNEDTDTIVSQMDATLKEYLFSALISFRNISSVKWAINNDSKDPEWALYTVVNALQTLSSLRSLDIYPHDAPTLKLDLIQSLHSIKVVSTSTSNDNVGTFAHLAGMIARSPALETITITRGGYRAREASANANLHQLFSQCSPSAPLIQLRKLVLEKMFLKADEFTIPHLHHLVSLKLTNIFEPEPSVSQTSDDASGEWEDEESSTAEEYAAQRSREKAGSTLDQFWSALSFADVHLEEIAVDQVGKGFLHYLASYTGLKKLFIQGVSYSNRTISDELARQFYGIPLLQHADALEELDVISGYEGGWCIAEHNVAAFTHCQRLTNLGVTVDSTLMNWRYEDKTEDDTQSPKQDIVSFLLESACSKFPNLRTLRVTSAAPESSRRGWCGFASSGHHSSIFNQIRMRLREFSPPAPYLKLPVVVLAGRHFVPCFVPRKEGEMDEWHYRDIADDPENEDEKDGEEYD